MLKRVLGLLGWLGVALVFAAVAIRFTRPEWQQWYNGLALAGLACTLLYILSQWREVARSFSGRQARLGSLAAGSVVVVLGDPLRHQLSVVAAQQAVGSHGREAVLAVRSNEESITGAAEAGPHPRLRSQRRLRAIPRTARRVPVRSRSRSPSSTSTWSGSRPWRAKLKVTGAGHGRHRVRRPDRAGHVRRRAGADQRADQGHPGQDAQGVLRPGTRRTRARDATIAPATARSRRR